MADLPSPVPPHAGDGLITAERARRWRQVLARRTGRLAVVIEDCQDPHNASAVVRTCDAFGIHRVIATTQINGFRLNPKVCQGSDRYIGLQVLPDITVAYAMLRAEGFRILVSDLAADAHVGVDALRPMLDQGPLAVVFGSESDGVSRAAADGADGRFLIPMVGFPQSLNLSVSVAITAHHLRFPALEADLPGDLPAAQQIALYDSWLRRDRGDAVELAVRREMDVDRQGDPIEVLRG